MEGTLLNLIYEFKQLLNEDERVVNLNKLEIELSSNRDVMVNAQKVGLVTQNYYKISIGFSLFSGDTSDYWFVRQKFD